MFNLLRSSQLRNYFVVWSFGFVTAVLIFSFATNKSHSNTPQTSTPKSSIRQAIHKVPNGRVLPIEKKIHQTWKTHTLPHGVAHHVDTWTVLNQDYEYKLWSDDEVESHMSKFHPEMMDAWAEMKPIEKADTFRPYGAARFCSYAILYDEGGVYTDIDAACRRPIDEWSRDANAYRNVDLMVGFEVATERPDWKQWFAMKYQLCQWTIAGRSGHPVFRRVLDKIIDFFKKNDAAKRNAMRDSVLHTTGPGIWSDAVHEYLDEEYQAQFGKAESVSSSRLKFGPEKAGEEPLHIGSVLLLPVRAFAINSGGYVRKPSHKNSDVYVEHFFQSSWNSGE